MNQRLRRWMPRLLRIILLVYLGLILVISLLQSWLIFPGHIRQGSRDAQLHPRSPAELVALQTPENEKLSALFVPAEKTDAPSILLFYGNGNCAADTDGIIHMFHALGFNVMVPDYVGYGMSTGKPSEAGCYATADAAWEYLTHREDINPNKIAVAGWSLGAAVATDLAARKPTAALLTFCAFTRMADMAHKVLPFLPTSLMLHHHFDNAAKFPNIKCPIFCAHGRCDTLIPHEMTEQLAKIAGVTPLLIDTANHNDFFEKSEDELPGKLGDFFEKIGLK